MLDIKEVHIPYKKAKEDLTEKYYLCKTLKEVKENIMRISARKTFCRKKS